MSNATIEIKAVVNCLGHLYLEPVHDADKLLISNSNPHDGTYNVYVRDFQAIANFLVNMSTVQRDFVINGWEQRIEIDYWKYCNMAHHNIIK